MSSTQINLRWFELPAFHQWNIGYKVERCPYSNPTGDADWTTIGTTSSLSYQDMRLKPGTHYYYRVFATGPGGISEDNSVADATTLPAQPLGTRLTQSQAIEIAKTFCRQIGQPVTSQGIAWYPAPNPITDEPDHHWQTRWLVVFGNHDADIEVVDASGVIAAYENHAYFAFTRMAERKRSSATAVLSQDEAIKRFISVQAATGQTEELKFPEVTLEHHDLSNPNGGYTYQARWRRHFHNIPYKGQGMAMTLDAETGEVMGLGLNFASPPAVSNAIRVSQNQALATAHYLLDQFGYANLRFVKISNEVVHPNTYWQPGGNENIWIPGSARVAWTCRFMVGSNVCEIWIDAETGEVIGGRGTGVLSGKPKAPSQSKSVIKLPAKPKVSK